MKKKTKKFFSLRHLTANFHNCEMSYSLNILNQRKPNYGSVYFETVNAQIVNTPFQSVTTGNFSTMNSTTGNITTGNITTGNITTNNVTTENVTNLNVKNTISSVLTPVTLSQQDVVLQYSCTAWGGNLYNCNISCYKLGNICTLYIQKAAKASTGGPAGAITFTPGLPIEFTPQTLYGATNISLPVAIRNNATYGTGFLQVGSDASLILTSDYAGTGFSGAAAQMLGLVDNTIVTYFAATP